MMVRGTLLIIDDDRGTRDGLQQAFIRHGWEVAVTVTEAEGLAILSDYEPDWIIVAWDQLGGTGARFMREVRAGVKGARVSLLTESGSPVAPFVSGLRPDLTFKKPVRADDVFEACESLTLGRAAVGRAV